MFAPGVLLPTLNLAPSFLRVSPVVAAFLLSGRVCAAGLRKSGEHMLPMAEIRFSLRQYSAHRSDLQLEVLCVHEQHTAVSIVSCFNVSPEIKF